MIYIDSEFKCHKNNPDGSFRAFDVSFFDDKCPEFIEGYRYIPSGESWMRSDGVVFRGEMLAPWKAYSELEAAQRAYERQRIVEYKALINELYAEVTS